MSYLVEYECRVRTPHKPLTTGALQLIETMCCNEFGITPEELKGAARTPEAIGAYMVFCYIARALTGASQMQIAIWTKRADHSTISNACERIKSRRATDPKYDAAISQLMSRIIKNGTVYVNTTDYIA